MHLHDLRSPKGARKRKKMVGRGQGSGHGKTSCRGQKGQTSRSGTWSLIPSEGGQMYLIRRLPKVGFRSKCPILYQVVNLVSIENKFSSKEVVSVESLKAKKLIESTNRPIKILGRGTLTKPVTVKGVVVSASAAEKITKAGGSVETTKKTVTATTKK